MPRSTAARAWATWVRSWRMTPRREAGRTLRPCASRRWARSSCGPRRDGQPAPAGSVERRGEVLARLDHARVRAAHDLEQLDEAHAHGIALRRRERADEVEQAGERRL